MEIIKNALIALGYHAEASVDAVSFGYHRVMVYVEDSEVGIYDLDLRTFVD